jgi:hypothetical protein
VSLKACLSDRWIKALEHYTKPALEEKVVIEVARLRCLTAKRKEGEFDMELSLGAITEELREYPIDIVQTVCREWARNNVFFPVLKELIDGCEKLLKPRNAILTASKEQKFIEFKKSQPDYVNPTDADKAKVSELVAQCLKNLSAG